MKWVALLAGFVLCVNGVCIALGFGLAAVSWGPACGCCILISFSWVKVVFGCCLPGSGCAVDMEFGFIGLGLDNVLLRRRLRFVLSLDESDSMRLAMPVLETAMS